eukprot:Gregarina_sp_Poly_1__484@NODE_1117_length_5035_cov_49_186594_g774_i0_p4_GENE_NODE_1117_length_5035_cov_49_186594_g774_i0NODE_1117_length_5035_cov_49_186594_g774_i0_p4_ORF_typecomplete_len133_score7_96INSIG/PF07281_12/0_052_NODE_1117_length_5035_cov_49_186594_g774_i018132211
MCVSECACVEHFSSMPTRNNIINIREPMLNRLSSPRGRYYEDRYSGYVERLRQYHLENPRAHLGESHQQVPAVATARPRKMVQAVALGVLVLYFDKVWNNFKAWRRGASAERDAPVTLCQVVFPCLFQQVIE